MPDSAVLPQHECGLFGVFGHPNAAVLTYYGLFALQHRGQESAGIVTSNGPGTSFLMHKDMGLVSQVFGQDELARLKGTRALGHTRYSTTGTSTIKNAQPFVVDCVRGQMAIAHNGNLINADILRDELERRGSIFQTTADSEIILHLLAQPSNNGGNILAALRRVEGAFSLLIMSERELIAVRDPFGWRPLALGKIDGAYVLASETCAFDLIHAEFIREIEPGEVLIINEHGLRSERPSRMRVPHSACSNTFISRGRTASWAALTSEKSEWKWDANWHADFLSKRTSLCPCPTLVTTPLSVLLKS